MLGCSPCISAPSFYRRENLVSAMPSGSRKWRGTPPFLPATFGHRKLVALTGTAALVWLLVSL